MSASRRTRPALAAAAAAVIGTAILTVWISRRSDAPSRPAANAGSPVPSPAGLTVQSGPGPTGSPADPDRHTARIGSILESDRPEPDKAEALLAMLPDLPEPARSEAMAHALNLMPDERFDRVRPWLRAEAPRPLAVRVLSDTAHRPDTVKLPLWLEILETPNHPLRAEARLLLLPYVGLEQIDEPAARRQAVASRGIPLPPEPTAR